MLTWAEAGDQVEDHSSVSTCWNRDDQDNSLSLSKEVFEPLKKLCYVDFVITNSTPNSKEKNKNDGAEPRVEGLRQKA